MLKFPCAMDHMAKTLPFILATVVTGAMAISRPLYSQASIVYPESYGAVGNGDPANASVNTTAINAALAHASNTGDTVLLNGVYYVNGQIKPKSGESLIAGTAGGIIKAVPNLSPPTSGYLVDVSGKSGFTMDGIELDGNRANQTQDVAHTYGGILVTGSIGVTIQNSKIHDFNGQTTGAATGNGVRTNISSNILISNNQIYSNNGCGINLYYSSTGIQVLNNTISDNTEIGIESEGRNGTNYTNYRNSSITLTGNTITGTTEAGRLSDHCILADWTDSAAISSNQCTNNNHNGIEILGCNNAVVSGNYCAYNGDVGPPYTWAGVSVTAEGFGANGNSNNTTINNNQIIGSQYGIYLNTGTGTVASGNTISGAPNTALTIGAVGGTVTTALTLSGPNTYTGGTIVNQGGTLLVNSTSGSGTGANAVTVAGGGTLGGSGTIGGTVTIAGGAELAPGTSASVGMLTVNGNMSLESGSLLNFKLAAVGASDNVSMTSSCLYLSGQQFGDFTFTALSGFGMGTYVLFDAGAITGSLGTDIDGTVGGLQSMLAVLGNDVVLAVEPEPGDANLDGRVDIKDLAILAANYRKHVTGGWTQADFNNDGVVDVKDLAILAANYRHSLASDVVPAYDGLDADAIRALSLAGVTVVPEPGTLALLAIGLWGLLACAGVIGAGSRGGVSQVTS